MLSIPALCGALLFKGIEAYREGLVGMSPGPVVCGIVVAGVAGYFAIRYLIRILCAGRAWLFGIYCLVAGMAGAIILWPR
jgi:undecaprenyl-diphosphatase